ncbi:hypothetical protein F4818DRAFT_444543 [Hypoxylon cercidicola]|nr:hypothetical protein F4818DRAFT_444543 [Hypoxylon cercidicola]
MASLTAFNPAPTLPAAVTSPPTAQFTPGPGCVDPEDHWVVITSCFADAIGYDGYTSPDWLTCQLTQFGPVEFRPTSCFVPYSAQTVVDAETVFYSGCPSGYTEASTIGYSRSDGLESYVNGYCCPTQYDFNVREYFPGGYKEFTTERDGVSYAVGYPLPGCATSYISELSGSEIPVQTFYNTYGWEKRQVENVPWDYLRGTMYAEMQSYSYTVFYGTHTCYQDCYGWHDYYFSGGTEPPFTVTDAVPVTTPVEEPTTTTPASSESEVETPPVEETSLVEETTPVEETSPVETLPIEASLVETSLVEESSLIEETGEPSSTAGVQTTSSPVTSSAGPVPTPTPSEGGGNMTSSSLSSPSSTISEVPVGAAAVVTPARLVLLGLLISLIAL